MSGRCLTSQFDVVTSCDVTLCRHIMTSHNEFWVKGLGNIRHGRSVNAQAFSLEHNSYRTLGVSLPLSS